MEVLTSVTIGSLPVICAGALEGFGAVAVDAARQTDALGTLRALPAKKAIVGHRNLTAGWLNPWTNLS
jgi:hypothetical protein